MPAKHNEKTEALAKQTKELFIQKEEDFKKKCLDKLQERLRLFDVRMEEYNQQRKVRVIEDYQEDKKTESLSKQNYKDDDMQDPEKKASFTKKNSASLTIKDEHDDLIDELEDDDEGDLMNDIYNMN